MDVSSIIYIFWGNLFFDNSYPFINCAPANKVFEGL